MIIEIGLLLLTFLVGGKLGHWAATPEAIHVILDEKCDIRECTTSNLY